MNARYIWTLQCRAQNSPGISPPRFRNGKRSDEQRGTHNRHQDESCGVITGRFYNPPGKPSGGSGQRIADRPENTHHVSRCSRGRAGQFLGY